MVGAIPAYLRENALGFLYNSHYFKSPLDVQAKFVGFCIVTMHVQCIGPYDIAIDIVVDLSQVDGNTSWA